MSGETAHDRSGAPIVGTATPGSTYTAGDGIDITNDTISVDTEFTEASARANIVSGDPFSTILGKIKKWFTDLKAVAFSGSYNDLSDKPTIPVGSDYVQKSGDTMTGTLDINRAGEIQANFIRNNSGTAVNDSTIRLGNGTADGTAGATRGKIRLYGNGTKYTDLIAPNSTASRTITFPNATGTVALTSDIPDISGKVNKSGDTMSGNLEIANGFVLRLSNGSKATSFLKPPVSAGGGSDATVYAPNKGGTLLVDDDLLHTYRTSEVKIGTWIDGRDLYERTVELTGLTAGGEQVKAHGINNIRQVCHWKAIIVDGTGSENLCNDWLPNAPDWGCFVQNVGPTNVGYYMGGSRLPYISKIIVTVEYTKTS
ncbi:MAG: hypothetical protein J6Y02_12500 [Pseudobutyrivibrio sp.]|nr:hypothetical protein [Pseudobutyrivibrio sp.]